MEGVLPSLDVGCSGQAIRYPLWGSRVPQPSALINFFVVTWRLSLQVSIERRAKSTESRTPYHLIHNPYPLILDFCSSIFDPGFGMLDA
jgi:hypothetical protein